MMNGINKLKGILMMKCSTCYKKFFVALSGVFVFILMNSCLEPFNANVPDEDLNLLVVEGYINAGSGVTQIALSRVSTLSRGNEIIHETNAEIKIESEDHETYMLSEKNVGVYVSDTLELPTDKQYRLLIKCSDGKEYASEFQSVKITPPIDSLHWEFRDQVYIYANSHDDQSETFFYTWTFHEDWLIKSTFESNYYYDASKDSIIPRFPSDALKFFHCWKKSTSDQIILGSSRSLTADAIKYPIVAIPNGTDKLQEEYGIFVNQRTMTEDEYNYLMLIKKNSQQTGSFFDPMPSQLFGNIHQVNDPEESVIGYIGSYTTEKNHLFISGGEVPVTPIQQKCPPTEFEYTAANLQMYLSNPSVLLPYQVYYEGDTVLNKRYVVAYPAYCMNCRMLGGTNINPNWSDTYPDWDK